jgi:hypothetical protein
MLSAYELFEELKPAVPFNKDEGLEQSLKNARELITRIQQKTLPEISESIPRQIGGMLFSHTLGALDAAFIQGEPQIYEKAAPEKKRRPAIVFAILAALATAAAVFLLKEQNHFWPMLCVLLSLVVWIIAFFMTYSPPKKAEYRIIPVADDEKLMGFVGEQMRLIDRDLEALMALCIMDNPQEISESALDAMMKIYEQSESLEIRQTITYYLKQNGLTSVEYTLHNAPMFQTLPSLAATRTLVPALLKDNRMVRQGLAIVKKEAAQ